MTDSGTCQFLQEKEAAKTKELAEKKIAKEKPIKVPKRVQSVID